MFERLSSIYHPDFHSQLCARHLHLLLFRSSDDHARTIRCSTATCYRRWGSTYACNVRNRWHGSANLNRHIGKLGRIAGVKAMGGHLYWHECRVETILDD